MPYLEANQDKTQDRLTQTDIAQAKARMPYLAANKKSGGAINSQSKAQQDRLELERKMALERARKQYILANRSQTQDRLTQDDVALAKARMKYMSENKKTFQNDRTKPLPKEAYTQDDQALRYDADTSTEGSFSHGGEVRGGGAAIRGKGFKGVF